jgi:hypothetical protein
MSEPPCPTTPGPDWPEWAAANPGIPVKIQIGKGEYEPRHAKWVRKLALPDYQARVAGCALFVAHCGMGSIISAIEAGKPILMLPRLQAMGEHNTDHQLATAKHVGILTGPVSGPASFIHSYDRLGVIEEPLTPSWARRIALAFLFPSPPETR